MYLYISIYLSFICIHIHTEREGGKKEEEERENIGRQLKH